MFYRVLRWIIRGLLLQFFSTARVAGYSSDREGPLLVVCNHPNYLLDSLVVASFHSRPLSFIAKATLFKNPVLGFLLRALKVLPLQRKQDNPDVELDNTKTFESVMVALENQQAVTIFPEGVSMGERKIFPVKTGAARMTLGVEARNNFSLGCCIQPVSITYAQPETFRSALTIYFGEPIALVDYREEYAEDERGAVRELTERIEKDLQALSVEVADESAALVDKLGRVYASAEIGPDDKERLQAISSAVERCLPRISESEKEGIGHALEQYVARLQELGLDFEDSLELRESPIFLLLAFPFLVLGYLVNWIPYRLVNVVTRGFIEHPVQTASYKLVSGVLLFPLWYLAISIVAWVLCGCWLSGVLSFVVIVCSSYCVNHYLHRFRLLWLRLKGYLGPSALTDLITMRDALIERCDAVQESVPVEYLDGSEETK
jgi:1-acyl-sn-glycerol-3-phosphate acyltransferase